MEEIHPKVKIVLNTLIEEKHRVRTEIDHLNQVFEAKNTQILSLVQLLTDLKTETKISNDQQKVETLLNESPESNHLIEIKSPTKKVNYTEKLKDCKLALKKHRKGVAKLAQSIKDELDVFHVCFLADLEAIEAKLVKPVTKSVLFSEIVHEDIEDEVVKPEEDCNNEIEIGRIHFEGIKKKPKRGKK